MAKFTLREVMRVLEEGWGKYVEQFSALSPEAQAAFLKKKEYETFHDLLAHIIGWWEEGPNPARPPRRCDRCKTTQ